MGSSIWDTLCLIHRSLPSDNEWKKSMSAHYIWYTISMCCNSLRMPRDRTILESQESTCESDSTLIQGLYAVHRTILNLNCVFHYQWNFKCEMNTLALQGHIENFTHVVKYVKLCRSRDLHMVYSFIQHMWDMSSTHAYGIIRHVISIWPKCGNQCFHVISDMLKEKILCMKNPEIRFSEIRWNCFNLCSLVRWTEWYQVFTVTCDEFLAQDGFYLRPLG